MRSYKLFKKILFGFLVFIVLLVTLFYCFRRELRNFLISYIVDYVAKKTDVTIAYSNLWGDPIFGIYASDCKIQSKSFKFEAEIVKLHYNLASFFHKRPVLSWVYLKNPKLVIYEKEKPPKKEKKLKFNFFLDIQNLLIEKGSFYGGEDPYLWIENSFSEIKIRPEKLKINVKKLKGEAYWQGDTLEIKKISARITADSTTVQIRNCKIKTPFLKSDFDGEINPEKFKIDIKDAKLALDSIPKLKHLKGEILAKGKFAKEKNKCKGELDIRLKGLSYKDIKFNDFKVVLSGEENTICLIGLTEDKKITLRSRLNLEKKIFDGILEFNNWITPKFKEIEAKIKGELSIKGSYASLISLDAVANFDSITLNGSNLGSLKALLFVERNKIEIKEFFLEKGISVVSVKGILSKDSIFGKVDISELSFEGIQNLVKLPSQFENLNSSLTIWGKPQNPVIRGIMMVKGKNFKKLEVEFIDFLPVKFGRKVKIKLDSLQGPQDTYIDASLVLQDSLFEMNVSTSDTSEGNLKGRWRKKADRLDVTGEYLELKSKEKCILKNRTPFRLSFEKGDIFLSNLELDSKTESLWLEFKTKGPKIQYVNLGLKNFKMETVEKFIKFKEPPKGTINLSFLFSNDKGNGDLEVEHFKLGGISIEKGLAKISLDTSNVVFNLWVIQGEDTSIVKGNLGYTPTPLKLNSYSLEAKLDNPGAWVFFFLKEVVEFKEGDIQGDLTLTSVENKKPIVEGIVNIKNATIYIPSLKLLGKKAEFVLSFEGTYLVLKSAFCKVGKGTLAGNGYFCLHSPYDYRFDFDFKNLSLNIEKIVAQCEGYITLFGKEGKRLTVKGKVDVEEALILYEFGEKVEGEGTEGAFPNLELELFANNNVWLRNSHMNIEFAPKLYIHTLENEFSITGELKVLRGSVYYLDHIFRVREGEIEFPSQRRINPEFNLLAELPTHKFAYINGEKEKIKIILHLRGNLENPVIELSSEPPIFSQSDIISYLASNLTFEELSQIKEHQIVTGVLSKVITLIQREVEKGVEQRTPFDYLELELSAEERRAKITVGKHIIPRLFVSYTHNPFAPEEDTYKLEFEVRKGQEIIFEKDEENKRNIRYEIIWEF